MEGGDGRKEVEEGGGRRRWEEEMGEGGRRGTRIVCSNLENVNQRELWNFYYDCLY